MGRPNTALLISESEKTQLRAIVRSRSMPHSLVRRARIVLLSADGASNRAVARECGVSAPVVSLWRQRCQRDGLAGLQRTGAQTSGRSRSWLSAARSRSCCITGILQPVLIYLCHSVAPSNTLTRGAA
jgi:hypothetical protein